MKRLKPPLVKGLSLASVLAPVDLGQTAAASGKEYGEGDVVIMGTDVVHSIHNPLRITNAALHVFAGNLFTTPHRQWDADTLQEAPFDNAYMMQVYPSPALAKGMFPADGPTFGVTNRLSDRPCARLTRHNCVRHACHPVTRSDQSARALR